MTVIDSHDELKQHLSEAEKRFAADAEGATMTVLKDDGLYRHLHFNFPKTSRTWPRTPRTGSSPTSAART